MKQIFPCLSGGLFAISLFFIIFWHHAVILLGFRRGAELCKALAETYTKKLCVSERHEVALFVSHYNAVLAVLSAGSM